MHIVKVAYEATAFDVRLTRGGTATMVWDLARRYAAAGHQVCIVTPAHGGVPYLRQRYGVEPVGPPDEHEVPLALDPAIWGPEAQRRSLPVRTQAYLLRREGVDIYFLSDAYLDLLPDTLYPLNEMQGNDLAFLKPLVFQVDAIRFIDRHLGGEPAVVQCYEPAYHYLLPPVLAARGATTVSTVVVNTRIDDVVYRPQVERVFDQTGVKVDLDPFVQVEADDALSVAMRDYLRPSHLRRDPGPDYVNYFALVASYADLVDYVSPGQRDYYVTFRDSPFEGRFRRLGVASVVRDTAHKHVVGGCALPDWWLERDVGRVDRAAVLTGLGLRPDRPTFYHAARLAHNHKGQLELFRAIESVLATDREVNFIVRCAVGSAQGAAVVGDPYFAQVAQRFSENVYLDWRMVDEEVLFEQAAASDFCLFPSKFELDGFLITMGEAMACGAVPVATAQETLSHYRHHRDVSDPDATGFAVPRSFRTDDPLLARRLAERIREAVRVFREDPATYQRLSRNSRHLARTFTWDRCASDRLAWFDLARRGQRRPYPDELAIEYGWFDHLDEDAWQRHRGRIGEVALAHGDVDAYARSQGVDARALDAAVVAELFDAAYRRADFARCERLADRVGPDRARLVRERCRIAGRRVTYTLPHAVRVDLIVPQQYSTGVGSGNRYTYPLRREGNAFVADLPPDLVGRDQVFLLTLASGRVAWDLVPPSLA
jgi:glycosyltransferase involved in cell wall biosynthesis